MNHLVNGLLEEADQQDAIHQRSLNKVADKQNLVTLTPWLRRTRWLRMFERREMKELVKLARLSDKTEIQLKTVCESIGRVIKDCTMSVMNCEDRN